MWSWLKCRWLLGSDSISKKSIVTILSIIFLSTTPVFGHLNNETEHGSRVDSTGAAVGEMVRKSPRGKRSSVKMSKLHGPMVLKSNEVQQSSFSIQGQPFYLTEKMNKFGLTTEQVLITNDRVSVSIDRNGDGLLDSWQLYTPHRDVTMREPHRGHFQIMEVEERIDKAILNMKFFRTQKGDYRLYAVASRKNKPMFKTVVNDFIVGCRASEQRLSDLAAIVNEAIVSDENHLETIIKDQIMQPNCKAGSFSSETDLMVKGIADVFKSDSLWGVAKKNEMTSALNRGDSNLRSVETHGLYLQCLRYYHLDTHASRIASAPATYLLANTKEDFHWKIDCKTIEGGKPSATCSAVSPVVRNECESSGIKSHGVAGELEQPSFGPPTISFVSDLRGGVKDSTRSDYARTFFHEMLHYALINDEWAADEIESCCSQPSFETLECKSLEKRLEAKKYAQAFENLVISALGDKYADYRNLMRETYGGNGDQVIDNFYGKVGEVYRNYVEGDLKCGFKKSDANYEQCKKSFNGDMGKLIGDTFGANESSDCRDTTSGNMSGTASVEYCQKLGGYMRVLTGLDPGELGKGFCPIGHASYFRRGDWQSELLSILFQSAEAEDIAGDLCTLSKATKSAANMDVVYTTTYNFYGKNGEIQQQSDNLERDTSTLAQLSSASNTAGGRTVTRSTANDSQSAFDKKGPQRPDYSGAPSDRAWKIQQDLNHQDSRMGRQLSSVAQRIFKPFVSVASASASRSASGSASGASQEEKVASRLPVPSVVIADPLLGSASMAGARPSQQVPNRAATGAASNQNVSTIPNSGSSENSNIGLSSQRNAGIVSSQPAANGKLSSTNDPAVLSGSDRDKRNPAGRTPADERALRALLVYLQRPYSQVHPELERPSVINSLKRHLIQVVDDQGQVFGSGYPKYKLFYDDRQERLVLKSGSQE